MCDVDSGKLAPSYVIAVCGGSCSGKTTIASSLAEELNKLPVPLARNSSSTSGQSNSMGSMRSLTRQKSAHLDPTDAAHHDNVSAICGDEFFMFDQYLTNSCPTVEINGHIWKDWESADSLNWESFVDAVTKAKNDPNGPKYIIVEGFLALAKPESRALFDAAIEVRLTKEECWKRRKGRALEMAGFPPGFSSDAGKRNYEVLPTYVKSDVVEGSPSHKAFVDAAATYQAEDGELAWLRMYFEEVIWPAALKQDEEFQKVKSQLPVLTVDATDPVGKDAWKQARVPECLAFVLEKLKADELST